MGQSRILIKTDYKEYYAHIRYEKSDKSSVAHHILEKYLSRDVN